MRITFLIRKRELSGTSVHTAAGYDADYLRSLGHTVDVVTAHINTSKILNEPADLLIVEGAGWVDPRRLAALKIPVVVRVHCAPEFLHYEFPGVCTTAYIETCAKLGMYVGFVSPELWQVFTQRVSRVRALPFVFPVEGHGSPVVRAMGDTIDIGCFGAIRPLKNHLGQLLAVAACRDQFSPARTFRFHINSTRIEGGAGIVNEIEALGRVLGIPVIRHPWQTKQEFTQTIREMNVVMCGSMAESFCMVAAEAIVNGVPVVSTSHIPWLDSFGSSDVGELAFGLNRVLNDPGRGRQTAQLWHANVESKQFWSLLLGEICQ